MCSQVTDVKAHRSLCFTMVMSFCEWVISLFYMLGFGGECILLFSGLCRRCRWQSESEDDTFYSGGRRDIWRATLCISVTVYVNHSPSFSMLLPLITYGFRPWNTSRITFQVVVSVI